MESEDKGINRLNRELVRELDDGVNEAQRRGAEALGALGGELK